MREKYTDNFFPVRKKTTPQKPHTYNTSGSEYQPMLPIRGIGQEPHVSAPQWYRIKLLGCHEEADLSVCISSHKCKTGCFQLCTSDSSCRTAQGPPDLIFKLVIEGWIFILHKGQSAPVLLSRDPPAPQSHYQHAMRSTWWT